MGICSNRGKQSVLVDLKHNDSKELLDALMKWADVIRVNQVSSQLALLGLTEEHLKVLNPHIIITQFTAYGGPSWGPCSDHVGYDNTIQASTGIVERFGGSLDKPEEHAHLGTVDVVSGWSGAVATCLALFKRLRTGQSDYASTSLAANG